MNTTNLQRKVSLLPASPGVYKFKNEKGKIIYIGKAKRLKNRVKSYFQGNLDKTTKTAALVARIHDLDYTETVSELEALILEAALIKLHKPKYNIALKDDKSYIYVVIRNEEVLLDGKKTKLPVVMAARETDLKKGDVSFGPYPDTRSVRHLIRTIRKAFPFRDCSKSKFNKYHKIGSPCLFGHLELCQAPCVGKVSPTEYRNEIGKVKRLLSGKSSSLMSSLEKKMNTASKNQNYEMAAKYRDQIKKFKYLRRKSFVAQKYLDNPYLVQDLREKSLQELLNKIPVLKKEPIRIECYDISNLSGTDAVGSMVVSIDGEISKKNYRKFKVKTKDTPDDSHMMAEVLMRRLKREVSNNKNQKKWGMPDLIVLDGGKGQLSVGLEVLKRVELEIPMVGLAKKDEIIVYFEDGHLKELKLTKENEGLKLLQRLRDESHRFAQSYHHKLRLKRVKK